MSKLALSLDAQKPLKAFLATVKHPSLISAYLYYVAQKFALSPVLFIRDKVIYQSVEDAIKIFECVGKLWRETEIKIGYVTSSVDDLTKKIYICPFTGKVFGDNTHPNPQDAIYEWVAHCKENTERIGGLKVKRFFISDDQKVIQEYASKNKPKAPITKIVFSSALNGKLFHAKESVIEDFRENYLKPMSLVEVQNQSRYQIEEGFMNFIEKQLADDKIAAFVEALSEIPECLPHVERWLSEAGSEG
ncbi:MAG: hypothetical protein JWO53_927 [Chlamydiia bacterium]|nr:hypothetical protein [Chlamydiia bacterium]